MRVSPEPVEQKMTIVASQKSSVTTAWQGWV